nr:sensor histidine kinase [Salirhabdus salicampi]
MVTLLLTSIFAYIESKQVEEHMGQLALRVATTVSSMPSVSDAFSLEEPSSVLQPLAEDVREKIGAEFVVIGNKDSIRYAHPEEHKIGKQMVGGDNKRALEGGEYYTSKAVGSLGPSLRGKAPIFDEHGEIIGIVSVGFLIEHIQTTIINKLWDMFFLAIFVTLIGVIGSILLAKSIRKDTLGLEPQQIARLFRERNAILRSIKEGIIAIDKQGNITMMNKSAKEMLGLNNHCLHQPIENYLPNTKMHEVLQSGKSQKNEEITLRDRLVIVNRTPIIEEGKVVGVVASFRDKTEIKEMVNTIFEVHKYSEGLRAQTHEYTNKLYVISGMLQLGHYDEAVQLIQKEYDSIGIQNRILFEQIEDRAVQAILLGKVSKASEKKISFAIDVNSTIEKLPTHIDVTSLIVIIGNLIDNAFDAVRDSQERVVTFFITDIGKDIIIEVSDSGNGIKDELIPNIFEKGFSTKELKNRGYGLTNVSKAVEDLNGNIEVKNQKEGGAVFSVYIPKEMGISA